MGIGRQLLGMSCRIILRNPSIQKTSSGNAGAPDRFFAKEWVFSEFL
jgi:hypothetical protein